MKTQEEFNRMMQEDLPNVSELLAKHKIEALAALCLVSTRGKPVEKLTDATLTVSVPETMADLLTVSDPVTLGAFFARGYMATLGKAQADGLLDMLLKAIIAAKTSYFSKGGDPTS